MFTLDCDRRRRKKRRGRVVIFRRREKKKGTPNKTATAAEAKHSSGEALKKDLRIVVYFTPSRRSLPNDKPAPNGANLMARPEKGKRCNRKKVVFFENSFSNT
jgi:hypothetical protein